MLHVEDGDEGGEGSEEGSTQDSCVSRPEEDQGEEATTISPRPTLAPKSNVTLPSPTPNLKRKRGGLMLHVEDGDEGGEGSEEGSTQDSCVSRPEEDQGEEATTISPRPTLAPKSNVTLPSPTPNLS
ncbi:uncharacterized protein A4U43_C08F19480 [Asparagus officinalis]|nr:uncharacterized protein A4U43_C08F19480 [Asparagus officinalis]